MATSRSVSLSSGTSRVVVTMVVTAAPEVTPGMPSWAVPSVAWVKTMLSRSPPLS